MRSVISVAIFLITLSAIAFGCMATYAAHPPEHYTIRYETPGGVRVATSGHVPKAPGKATISNWYNEVQRCVGIWDDGPLVILSEHRPTDDIAAFWHDSEIIQIRWTPKQARREEITEHLFKHEVIHYLLWRAGIRDPQNTDHASPLFDQCAPFPTTVIID